MPKPGRGKTFPCQSHPIRDSASNALFVKSCCFVCAVSIDLEVLHGCRCDELKALTVQWAVLRTRLAEASTKPLASAAASGSATCLESPGRRTLWPLVRQVPR
jgi:hypothetical protein